MYIQMLSSFLHFSEATSSSTGDRQNEKEKKKDFFSKVEKKVLFLFFSHPNRRDTKILYTDLYASYIVKTSDVS